MQESALEETSAVTLISKGKGVEVIEIATVTEEQGTPSYSCEDHSNLEHVLDIDMSLLADEDLSGDWWKHYDPPKELIWTEEDTAQMKGLEFGEWIEKLENVLQEMQNGISTEEPTTPTIAAATRPGVAEVSRPDPADIAPEVLLDAIEVIPPPPPANPPPQARRQLRVSTSSIPRIGGAAELESPTSPTSAVPATVRRSIAGSLSYSSSKKSKLKRAPSSKHEFVMTNALIYSPYFSPLPPRDKSVASTPTSPRVEQVKRFWKKRSGESECSSCLDDHKNRKLVTLRCQHKYCSDCLETLIKTAIQDESLWPPHCCIQDIPLKIIKNTLSKKDQQVYNDKSKEYAVPAADRIYCAQATCSSWIPPTTADPITCPKCQSGVCRTCRGAVHPAQDDCPEDFELKATLEEGERQGWRRCFQCRTMVERTDGCNHMTCNCTAEFCYICGVVWKTCTCRPDEEVHRRAAREEQEAINRAIREQEEAEVQAAIAAAEAMIRQEQEEQARREHAERIAAENREREEALRREKEAEMERLMQQRWLEKVDAEYDAVQKAMSSLHQKQWEILQERYQQERERLEKERIEYEKRSKEKLFEGVGLLEKRRIKEEEDQKARFEQEREALSNEQAMEEDEYWFGLQSYLKGRPNKEGRQKVLMEKFNAGQKEQMDTLCREQEEKSNELTLLLKEQLANFESSMTKALEEEKQNGVTKVKDTTRHQYADMQWLGAVKVARSNKLVELERTTKTNEDAKRQFCSKLSPGAG